MYNPFRYSGEYYDQETDLIYLRNRYYDPSIGRFITEDPIKDGLNWYVYCGNNPVQFIDPSGLTIRALTEIAAERGLSVIWNGKSGSDWAVTVDGHCITLNYQHTDGDWHLKLDGFAQSGDELSLHSSDNKVYIDDSLFNCWIDDGSGATEIKFEWYVGAAVAGIKAPGIAKGIITTLAPSAPQIGQISLQTQNHIMQDKHAWGKVVSNPNSWNEICDIVMNVVKNGTESSYGAALQKTMQVKDQIVVVTYKIVDGVIRISDGWVQTK